MNRPTSGQKHDSLDRKVAEDAQRAAEQAAALEAKAVGLEHRMRNAEQGHVAAMARHWLETAFPSLATFVFLLSFALPRSLIRIHMERYVAALDATKPSVLKDLRSAKG